MILLKGWLSLNSVLQGYRRGEIWWVKLDPIVGVEAAKTRACLILQNDAGNRASLITTIVPFLTKKNYSFVVNVLPTLENGLDKERGLHFNQIRSVDRSRMTAKIGEIEAMYWNSIKTAIDIQLGFY
jgi:mRNA interferase MazF